MTLKLITYLEIKCTALGDSSFKYEYEVSWNMKQIWSKQMEIIQFIELESANPSKGFYRKF